MSSQGTAANTKTVNDDTSLVMSKETAMNYVDR